MRPTGAMHLGHYHGALKNWVRLQHEHECFFFVADWHALTTHYEEREVMERYVYDMVIDWLAGAAMDKRIVILISGRGSNMEAIVQRCAEQRWPAQVVAVIANRADAAGLAFAAAQGVASAVVDHGASDAVFGGERQSGRVRPVGHHGHHLGRPALRRTALDDGLHVGATAGDEDDDALHGVGRDGQRTRPADTASGHGGQRWPAVYGAAADQHRPRDAL